MRIQMYFPNLHSAAQDVSASSQQLHEPRFLVRLARKQQFILRGTLGLKAGPSKRKKRGFFLNLNHVGPLIANHLAGREPHATASLCRASQGARFGSEDASSRGEAAHRPGQHCCLHAAPLLRCHSSPGKSLQPLLGHHLPGTSMCLPSVVSQDLPTA